MATQTQSTLSDSVKTQYLRRLLMRAVPRLIHGRFGEKANASGYGSLEWRKFGAITVAAGGPSALSEGVTPESESTSVSTVTATPAFYGSYLQHTDELEMTAYDPIVSEFSNVLGEHAGLAIDTLIREDILGSSPTTRFAGSATARGNIDSTDDKITYIDFLKAVAVLMANSALPVDGARYACILHPHSYATLMNTDRFVNTFLHASPRDNDSNPMRTGFMGTFLNVDIYISGNAREYADAGTSSTADVYIALFIGREAYGVVGVGNIDPRDVDGAGNDPFAVNTGKGRSLAPVDLIVKPLGSGGAEDPLNQRGTVAWKAAHDTAMLNSDWIISLEHANEFTDA